MDYFSVLPSYSVGFPITFLLGSAICFVDLREAAFLGVEGRRTRYPVFSSIRCWAIALAIGVFACLCYLLVIKYPELVVGSAVPDLNTGGWLLASFVSGLGAVSLVRSKLFPVGEHQFGLEPIYEMVKSGAIDGLVQNTGRRKQLLVEEYAGRFNGSSNFAEDLKDYVTQSMATRPDDLEPYQSQVDQIAEFMRPGNESSPDDWEQFHRKSIRLALDYLGVNSTKKWLDERPKD